jgi:hypothetical protein
LTITKGLIIADPWIGFILGGTKTWEMRSSSVSHRGWFGLIRKGTGAVYGVARLTDVGAPLSPDEMIASFERHRIPEGIIRSGEVAKWNTPWKLADVRRLASPVPYRHRSGAVTWVEFDSDVSEAIARQLGALPQAAPVAPMASQTLSPRASIEPHRQQAPVASPVAAPRPAANGKLIGHVEITQGNIDNNHIYLRSFFNRFPEDAIGGSNRREKAAHEVTVDWGGGAPVQTDLDGSKRLFRARGWIRNFFELNDVVPGDQVLVEETGPYAYKVRLQKTARA